MVYFFFLMSPDVRLFFVGFFTSTVGRHKTSEFDNHPLIIAYAVVTTLLVATHLFSLMVSTFILPFLASAQDSIGHSDVPETTHETQLHAGDRNRSAGDHAASHVVLMPTPVKRKPKSFDPKTVLDAHYVNSMQDSEHYGGYIQLAWLVSTGFGIILFLVDLTLIAYIKVCLSYFYLFSFFFFFFFFLLIFTFSALQQLSFFVRLAIY